MRRRNLQRVSLTLLPLVLLLVGLLISWPLLGALGFGKGMASLVPRAALEREADERVDRAVAALTAGNTAAGDQAIRQAILLWGGGSGAFAEIGRKLTAQGRAADAVRLLAEATRDKTLNTDPALWAALADAYEKAGNTAQAEPARAEANQRAAAIMATAGKGVPASGSALTPEAIRFLQVGLYYSEIARDAPNAIIALREALRLAPKAPETLNALGYTLADKGTTGADFEEALRLTRQAAEAAPEEPNILDSYGWALYKTGDLAGAHRVLREAVDRAPDQPELRYHLGAIYQKLGQKEHAILEFDRALLLKPDFPEVTRDRQALQPSSPAPR